MKTLQKLLTLTLLSILPACGGQLVEFGDSDSTSGNAGVSARGGNAGRGGSAGGAGSSGSSGSGGTSAGRGGSGGTAGSVSAGDAGQSGAAGDAGESGGSGEGGQSGRAGNGGEAGFGGVAGTAGLAGSSGTSGIGGGSGTAGIGGNTGTAGLAGSSGTAGLAGNSGTAGIGGIAGIGGTSGVAGVGGIAVGGLGGGSGEGGALGGVGGVGGDPGDVLTVVRTNPANLDTNVAINKVIEATLSETMDITTLDGTTFFVEGPGTNPVAGEVDYDALNGTASFTPSSDLLANTTFKATITRGARDLLGNSLLDIYEWTFTTGSQAAQAFRQPTIVLGAASSFVILASAGITNIPNSMLFGDVGLTPDAGSNIIGLTCPEMMLGTIYVVDQTGPPCALEDPTLLAAAKLAAQAAYLDATASVRGPPTLISGDLNGLTLYPGLYESGSSLEIAPDGRLYLDAQGDSSAVFIIRSATSITTEATSQVVLTKGANASNIYWTAGSAVTLGTSSIMKGTLIATTALSLLAGANLEGRALNQSTSAAAITLSGNTIRLPTP
jgi:hypothetical protein